MILVASQRGGAKQLGLHLLKISENEHVEVHEVRGFVSEDVIGALKEAQAISQGTRCKQYLFSVSLNPPATESVPIEVFEGALARIEARTGLADQPRVIVFHEKEGRRHAHCVWSRIDADTMTAVNMAHFKSKLRDISRELYLEHGWQMPRGLMNTQARDPRNFTLAEWQQAKRLGLQARDLKTSIQECWAVSDSRAAFEKALSERGLILARGDRRGHVAVTYEGEVLSIARYAGKKAKEVRARLGNPERLPSADEARASMAKDMAGALKRHLHAARQQTAQETAEFEMRRQALAAQHRAERNKLDTAQQERWAREMRERAQRLRTGVRGIWDRLTGQHRRMRDLNERETIAALQRDRAQRQTMIDAQLRERRTLQTEMIANRRRQAEQLRELRQDRDRYSQRALPTQEQGPQLQGIARPTPEIAGPNSKLGERLERLRRQGIQEDFRAATRAPSVRERLRALRDHAAEPDRSRDQGPERER